MKRPRTVQVPKERHTLMFTSIELTDKQVSDIMDALGSPKCIKNTKELMYFFLDKK